MNHIFECFECEDLIREIILNLDTDVCSLFMFSQTSSQINSLVCEYVKKNNEIIVRINISSFSITNKYFNILWWAFENGYTLKLKNFKIDKDTIKWVQKNKTRNPVLEWIMSNDSYLDMWICTELAYDGDLEILKWLHSRGRSYWSTKTCSFAAMNGQFETLKWLRSNGCPWDDSTCRYAAHFDHFGILQWAILNGCPWSNSVFKILEKQNYTHICEYMTSNIHLCID